MRRSGFPGLGNSVDIQGSDVEVVVELNEKDRRLLSEAAWLPALGPYGCFGQHWTVETDDDGLAELVTDLYADLALDSDTEDVSTEVADVAHARFRVVVGAVGSRGVVTRDDRLLGGGTEPAMLSSLVWGINRWVLDGASRTHLLLHAGGVVDRDGKAVILPAPSESGKSTLTMGLLDRGLTYLSDEAVSLANDGTVRGYSKPVSIDRGSFAILTAHRPIGSRASLLEHQWHVRASAVSAVARMAHLNVVVFPRYDKDARSTALEPLGPSAKLLKASGSTFAPGNGRRVERDQVTALAGRLTGVPAYDLVSSDLDDACDAVLYALREVH